MIDTKQRILDTAERLFGEQGFGATSLRHVIAEARVNVAAVHYHFGSKDDLLTEVVSRKIDPVNVERLALLERARGVERILDAFLRPALELAVADPAFCKLMGRLLAEGLMPILGQRHFQEVAARFVVALRTALPNLTEGELAWRIHFLIGAMAHAMQWPPAIPGIDAGPGGGAELSVRRMVAVFTAGFQAPATQAINAEMKA